MKLPNKALLSFLLPLKSSHTLCMLRFIGLRGPKNSSCYATSETKVVVRQVCWTTTFFYLPYHLVATLLEHTEKLILHNIDILVGALHMEPLTSILLKKFVIIQSLQHCTILLDTSTIVVTLLLHTRDAMTHFDGCNQIAHSKHGCVNKYYSRNTLPYSFTDIQPHNNYLYMISTNPNTNFS